MAKYEAVRMPSLRWAVVRIGPKGGRTTLVQYDTTDMGCETATEVAELLNRHAWQEYGQRA